MSDQDTHVGATIEPPIVVPETAVPQIVTTAVRYLLAYIAGALAARGLSSVLGIDLTSLFTNDQTVQVIAGLVIAGAMAVWGALKSKQNVQVQQALESKLPNRVARRG
jgi:hypothetical protein